ncbi:DUF2892 domain-containing protein [Ancylomarina sp. 16SWW S1-10-2]|uniref:YgaP family membrane protein n=1 Tax=Ancylomarina sp. 16SWW S1-10-2 TaxID=2499681 RepID=UPI0012AE5A31|nr:DUF2892 domain-containing protein [Ancylomarina sp. 16SWW S1-10-2]MRT93572.1 DUF2892 domain-containing protein [Ancylomarina sp. 16SWW S1-10-2]
MKKNMGPIDRIIRSIVALTLITLFIFNVITGTIGIIVTVLASIMLISAIIGNCPPYALMGFNSCKRKE